MRVFLVNIEKPIWCTSGKDGDITIIPKFGNERRELLTVLRQNPEATLILDTEIRMEELGNYQDLRGLQLAYELRANPEIKYRGFIKLHGFLPLKRLKEHKFGGLLRSGDTIHGRVFCLKGAIYVRYPSRDFRCGPALSETEYEEVARELDEIFIREFRDFEHSFRNVTILPNLAAPQIADKKKELASYLRTIRQIEKTTNIRPDYMNIMRAIERELQDLIEGLSTSGGSSISEELGRVKAEIFKLRQKLLEGKKYQ
ncbi:MAG: hypothetical protein IMZ61_08250 [Planctomycetes bacterium]|nr:hypothetical protein [Planctomycetota bacterium]